MDQGTVLWLVGGLAGLAALAIVFWPRKRVEPQYDYDDTPPYDIPPEVWNEETKAETVNSDLDNFLESVGVKKDTPQVAVLKKAYSSKKKPAAKKVPAKRAKKVAKKAKR